MKCVCYFVLHQISITVFFSTPSSPRLLASLRASFWGFQCFVGRELNQLPPSLLSIMCSLYISVKFEFRFHWLITQFPPCCDKLLFNLLCSFTKKQRTRSFQTFQTPHFLHAAIIVSCLFCFCFVNHHSFPLLPLFTSPSP